MVRTSRLSPFAHGDGHDAVQFDNQGWVNPKQPAVENWAQSRAFGLSMNLLAREHLTHYHLAHSARADLCRRLERIPEDRASYEKALDLAPQASDRRFLARRLEELK